MSATWFGLGFLAGWSALLGLQFIERALVARQQRKRHALEAQILANIVGDFRRSFAVVKNDEEKRREFRQ